jgi:glycerol dehydrogenase-like iron-containing ADH family enzyme
VLGSQEASESSSLRIGENPTTAFTSLDVATQVGGVHMAMTTMRSPQNATAHHHHAIVSTIEAPNCHVEHGSRCTSGTLRDHGAS